MAGFFPLGGGGRGGNHLQNNLHTTTCEIIHPADGLFWYKNHESLEIWQQQQQQQQQQQAAEGYIGNPARSHHLYSLGGPGLSSGDESPPRASLVMVRSGRGGGQVVSCQDCGNQAKKDCLHMRCRTCCKSRGLECETHVKSTWVPASKRRERQLHGGAYPKRPRDQNRPPAAASPGLEMGNFPAEVSSSAVFRCVRMTSLDENDDHYAYQTAVNIGGHVFKGILYDHGPEQPNSTSPAGFHITAASSAQMPAGAVAPTSESPPITAALLHPPPYPTPLNTYIAAGTQFFLPPTS